jgi:hypothetical protein
MLGLDATGGSGALEETSGSGTLEETSGVPPWPFVSSSGRVMLDVSGSEHDTTHEKRPNVETRVRPKRQRSARGAGWLTRVFMQSHSR